MSASSDVDPRHRRLVPHFVPFNDDGNADEWRDLSHDLIARFLDAMALEYGSSRGIRRGYRSDLRALDGWMQITRGRSLATARRTDLLTYLLLRKTAGMRTRMLERLLMCLQHFYRHLRDLGMRVDNAAAQLHVAAFQQR